MISIRLSFKEGVNALEAEEGRSRREAEDRPTVALFRYPVATVATAGVLIGLVYV